MSAPSGGRVVILASTRNDIAGYVDALFYVYSLLIIAYIVVNSDLRVRRAPAVQPHDQTRSSSSCATSPSRSLAPFRKIIPPLGPLDLSPIIALIVLRIVSAIVGGRLDRRVTGAGPRGRGPGLVLAAVLAADQLGEAIVRSIVPGDRRGVLPGVESSRCATTGSASGCSGGERGRGHVVVSQAALAAYFVFHLDRPLVWLPVGLLLGGALGNVIDRLRDGAVTDFLKLPMARLQPCGHRDHRRVLVLSTSSCARAMRLERR